MKRLFDKELKGHYLMSDVSYKADTSVFFKAKLEIIDKDKSLECLLERIKGYKTPSFKIEYVTISKELTYQQRLETVACISSVLDGIGKLNDYQQLFGVTYVDGIYYFGKLEYPSGSWKDHQQKPQSYSQSLDVRMARSLVNIAVGMKRSQTIIDPLCGVGTVVLEGLYLGLDIIGSDRSKGCVWKANRNLSHFGYPSIVTQTDIFDIQAHYDGLIMDIPYNLYSQITKDEQHQLILKAKEIASTFILITYEEFDDYLISIGYKINEKILFKKQKMTRYIYVCN